MTRNACLSTTTQPREAFAGSGLRPQRGAVLIVSMILLLIMTLIGVTGMSTTTLEEKMAANTQEVNRAFQAGETALALAFTDTNAYVVDGTYLSASTMLSDVNGYQSFQVGYESEFVGWSLPPIDSGYSAIHDRAAHFDFLGTGATPEGISKQLHGGAFQITSGGN